jgi:hypothetical protein
VRDSASVNDRFFMDRIQKFNPKWEKYQQEALYFMRNGDELRRELCAFFKI